MGLLEMTALAFALGTDCFSVCVGLGMDSPNHRRAAGLSLVFGAMQGLLVGVGYHVATALHWFLDRFAIYDGLIGNWASAVEPHVIHEEIHWILSLAGASVLAAVGINLIAGFFQRGRRVDARLYRGRLGVLILAFTVNIDAFSAGLGLGMLDGIVISLVIAIMCVIGGGLAGLGLGAGQKLGDQVGRLAQPVGGVVLIVIALRVVAVAMRA